MLYVHENNLKSKIKENYKGTGSNINTFFETEYLSMRKRIENLTFDEAHIDSYSIAANVFNEYYDKLSVFSSANSISSQSKFASTFLEEISCYLFKDLQEIKNNIFDVYNKGIYAGLKIDSTRHIAIIKKDVDFCIGKRVNILIDSQFPLELVLPIIAVEVKTYLDATMFGEIKSSSKAIRSASPNSKTYVLMGYKNIADEHIIAARQDAALTEIFCLRENKSKPIRADVLFDYWHEIKNAVCAVSQDIIVPSYGRLLNPPIP